MSPFGPPQLSHLSSYYARSTNRWIQCDLFQKHYVRDDEEAAFNLAAQRLQGT